MAEGSRCATPRKPRDGMPHAWENRRMDPAHDDHRTRFLQLALRADALERTNQPVLPRCWWAFQKVLNCCHRWRPKCRTWLRW